MKRIKAQLTQHRFQIDGGSNPVAINQFLIFFSVGSTCSRSLFSFANILYFTWLILFDLTVL